MTNIGIVRKVDSLGRVTLPKELRRVFQLENDVPVEILATEHGILIRNPTIEIKRIEDVRIGGLACDEFFGKK